MSEDKKVKVYTTPTCTYCTAVKRYLDDHDVDYEEVDVAEDEEALEKMKEKTGQMGVPVTEINGDMVVGFDKEKISKLLEIN